ncbi:hypothetical protein VNO77_27640 [Canavalia gladiata]|uniref:Uncharacterized protein n=1 Tax=Canavalia gladiata TaxID=3824 RepID=A0AAN9KXN2_CANGL
MISREDMETLEHCKALSKRGEGPSCVVVYDSHDSYTVEANGPIKDVTFIIEYTGHDDYIKNRECYDCDNMMTFLLASGTPKSLIICAGKHGNIARFINGINSHTQEGLQLGDPCKLGITTKNRNSIQKGS